MAFRTSCLTGKTVPFLFLFLCFSNSYLSAQQVPNRLAVTGGTVMAFNSTGATIEARQAVSEGEKIRTGEASFASLTISNEDSVTVGEKSHIEILRLGASPVIRLESGTLRVASQHTDIQIMTRSGLFVAAEWPFSMQLGVNEGGVSMDVTEGAVRISELGTGLTVRSPTPSTNRTYVVGGNHTAEQTAPTEIVFPCGGYPGYPTNSPTPALSPAKPGAPGKLSPPVKP